MICYAYASHITAIYDNICLYKTWRFSFNGLAPSKNIYSHSSTFTSDRSDTKLVCWSLPSKSIFDMSSFFKESWLISSSKLLAGHFSTLHWPNYSFSWPLLSPYSTLVVVVTLTFDGCKWFLVFPWMMLWCCNDYPFYLICFKIVSMFSRVHILVVYGFFCLKVEGPKSAQISSRTL